MQSFWGASGYSRGTTRGLLFSPTGAVARGDGRVSGWVLPDATSGSEINLHSDNLTSARSIATSLELTAGPLNLYVGGSGGPSCQWLLLALTYAASTISGR